MLRIIASVLLLAGSASAEPIYGQDTLGLAQHNVQVLAEEIDANSAIGVLDVTFGDPYPKLKRLLDTGKVRAVRMHLIDGTCIRNHVCPPGAPGYADLDTLKKRVKRLHLFAGAYPGVAWFVSPWLEHDCKDRELVKKWFQIIAVEAPEMVPVCSAFTGFCPPGPLKESHGFKSGDIISPDGIDHVDLDSIAYRSMGRAIVFSWRPQNNGRVSGEKVFVPPLKRVNWPTRDDIRQQVRLLRQPQPNPPLAQGCRDIRKPELSKTNAEFYGSGQDDGRGNKLLFIANAQLPKVGVYAVNGRTVGSLSYYGPFSGGGFRHYIGGRYGSNQTPTQLMDQLGGEWGYLRSGAKCWQFNAIRRLGYFRE